MAACLPWQKLDHFLFAFVGLGGMPVAAVVMGNDEPFKIEDGRVSRFCNHMIEKAAPCWLGCRHQRMRTIYNQRQSPRIAAPG